MKLWLEIARILVLAAGTMPMAYLEDKHREPPQEVPVSDSLFPRPQLTVLSNLPPRSQFVGREQDKARLYEALTSSWSIVYVGGIGGIGKTALALEVVHASLQASLDRAAVAATPPETQSPDPLESYLLVVRQLKNQLGREHTRYTDLLTYENRLEENLSRVKLYGDNRDQQSERSEIISRLNRLALSELGISFNEMLHRAHPIPTQQASTNIPIFAGYVWTTAKDRQLSLNDILDTIARTLDRPGLTELRLPEKSTSIDRLLREAPFLLVVDNFETIADPTVRDFVRNLPNPSKILITGRGDPGIDQAKHIILRGLPIEETRAIILREGQRLDLASMEQVIEGVLPLLQEATGGTPLAIKWAMGNIKHSGQSLNTILASLRDAKDRVFDEIFARSWGLLTMDAQRVLLVMPLFSASASRAGIEAAAGVQQDTLDQAIAQLAEMSLLEADERDWERRRYSIHPLTRAYARAQSMRTAGFEAAAWERLARFYHSFTQTYGGLWNRAGDAYLEPELPNILAIVQESWNRQLVTLGAETLFNVSHYMTVQGSWNDLLELTRVAVLRANQAGDKANAAKLQAWFYAWITYQRGDCDKAEEICRSVLPVLEQLGMARDAAFVKRTLARIAQRKGQFGQAETLFYEALSMFASAGDQNSSAYVTDSLANLYVEQGDLDHAWSLCNDALPAARGLENRELLGNLLHTMARIAHQRGEPALAKIHGDVALECLEQGRVTFGMANVLVDLGRIETALGNRKTSIARLHQALAIYEKLAMYSHVQTVQEMLTQYQAFS